MKTIATFQNGQIQSAAVSWEEFKSLRFKHETAKILVSNATAETVDYIKVVFNSKGQVVCSSAFMKSNNKPTTFFKKEILKKNGQLTKKAIAILKEVAK